MHRFNIGKIGKAIQESNSGGSGDPAQIYSKLALVRMHLEGWKSMVTSRFTGLAARVIGILLVLRGGSPCGDFSLSIGEARAEPLGDVVVPIFADAPVSYQGFSFTVKYPPEEVTFRRVGVDGTILEAMKADFVHGEIFPLEGMLILGVLMDTRPPFDGAVVPAIGAPLEVARISGQVLQEQPGEIPLEFALEEARPAVANIFSVENQPVVPRLLVGGKIIVGLWNREPCFIRGDANLDWRTDISDPIAILANQFLGWGSLYCEDAADANFDDRIDISDALFLFNFLYLGGKRPLPPQDVPGPDPSRGGQLGCEVPLIWRSFR
jgi:hypothetical protein